MRLTQRLPMQVSPGHPTLEKIARRWHDLAEQRLAYYTDLYRSGRWQHYYTQEVFAARMLDVIEDAKKWRQLASRPQMPPEAGRGEAQVRTAA